MSLNTGYATEETFSGSGLSTLKVFLDVDQIRLRKDNNEVLYRGGNNPKVYKLTRHDLVWISKDTIGKARPSPNGVDTPIIGCLNGAGMKYKGQGSSPDKRELYNAVYNNMRFLGVVYGSDIELDDLNAVGRKTTTIVVGGVFPINIRGNPFIIYPGDRLYMVLPDHMHIQKHINMRNRVGITSERIVPIIIPERILHSNKINNKNNIRHDMVLSSESISNMYTRLMNSLTNDETTIEEIFRNNKDNILFSNTIKLFGISTILMMSAMATSNIDNDKKNKLNNIDFLNIDSADDDTKKIIFNLSSIVFANKGTLFEDEKGNKKTKQQLYEAIKAGGKTDEAEMIKIVEKVNILSELIEIFKGIETFSNERFIGTAEEGSMGKDNIQVRLHI